MENSRKRFPLWIWPLVSVVLLVLLLALFTPIPHNLAVRLELRRALRAERNRHYLTAERELKAYMAEVPDNMEAEGRLMVAAFYNQDFETFIMQFNKLKDKEMKDKELLAEIDGIMVKAAFYYPTDAIKVFSERHPFLPAVPDSAWDNYFTSNPADVEAKSVYANELFREKRYALCDSVVDDILSSHSDFFPALLLGASVKREEEDYDKALEYNKTMLMINPESAVALASETRTLLRLRQDPEALDAALQAYKLADKDAYVRASLILAYHYAGRKADRDALIQKSMKEAVDSSAKETIQYALDVMAKKEKFRD